MERIADRKDLETELDTIHLALNHLSSLNSLNSYQKMKRDTLLIKAETLRLALLQQVTDGFSGCYDR